MTDERIQLAHGGGGDATRTLIEELILPRLGNPLLNPLTDAAIIPVDDVGKICITTDASVVQPLEFPGGDIGRLAVSGTVNDLAVMGATPRALTLSMIIEEGLEKAQLIRILDSVAATAAEAGVVVAAGDTKVIEHGSGDGLYLATAGVGLLRPGIDLGLPRVAVGDLVCVTGDIADHGLALMALREGLSIDSALESDVAPLADLAAALCDLGEGLRFLRDPTRGGLAGVLVDIAEGSECSVEVDESAIPIAGPTHHIAELLGLDPLVVANEGKLVAVIAPELEEAFLKACHAHPRATRAAVIGRVVASVPPPLVELVTGIGGRRIVRRAYGEELPRIC
ncbi:MAG: hydrogenase expression/formation protein HypE [Deltaproteobacteria bacterium]|nr:hydrogenase expression/formation protein HypE [Deltaproteobacteria bacterium]